MSRNGRPIPRGKPRGVSYLFRRPEDGFVPIRVRAHGLDVTVNANSFDDAFRAAMLTADPDVLGEFVSFQREGDEERWGHTANFLKRTGFTIEWERGGE